MNLTAVLLIAYAALALSAAVWIWQAPHHSLWILVVLLPAHALAMTLIFHGIHPSRLVMGVFQSWKDVVLAVGLLSVCIKRSAWSGLQLHPLDALIGMLAGLALLSIGLHIKLGLVPQLLALRNDFIFIPVYALGRLMQTSEDTRQRTILVVAGTVGVIVSLGIIEQFLDPLQALIAIELPQYLQTNFHLRFLSYGGLPYSFFQSNFARRVGSIFLDPVQLAEFGALGIGAAGALLIWTDRRKQLGLAVLVASVIAVVLAAGRFELLITPVLLATVALATRRLKPAIIGITLLAALFVGFSLTFYSWPYRGPGANPTPASAMSVELLQNQGHVNYELVATVDPSLQSHFAGVRQALSDAVHHPFGQGLGTAGLTGARNYGTGIAEGQLLVMVHSLGDPGIIVLTAILVTGILVSWSKAGGRSGAAGLGVFTLVLLVEILLTLPVAEIMANTLLITAAFWGLGQVVRFSGAPAGNTIDNQGRMGGNGSRKSRHYFARPS